MSTEGSLEVRFCESPGVGFISTPAYYSAVSAAAALITDF